MSEVLSVVASIDLIRFPRIKTGEEKSEQKIKEDTSQKKRRRKEKRKENPGSVISIPGMPQLIPSDNSPTL